MMKGIWLVFTLHTLVMKQNKPCLHTFPEDNLSLLNEKTDQHGVSLLYERLSWKPKRQVSTCSLPCVDKPKVLGFSIPTVPKAETIDVEQLIA